MFSVVASLSVPFIAVVLRKCYGLGAQAMLGGSTSKPDYTVSWPSGEFGPMGLEGAVKLGFKAELEKITDDKARRARFDTLLQQAYAKGQASEVASVLEIDAVIDPVQTREVIANSIVAAST
jgi:acetyl-CoA carboxylase carboxyltransferase component